MIKLDFIFLVGILSLGHVTSKKLKQSLLPEMVHNLVQREMESKLHHVSSGKKRTVDKGIVDKVMVEKIMGPELVGEKSTADRRHEQPGSHMKAATDAINKLVDESIVNRVEEAEKEVSQMLLQNIEHHIQDAGKIFNSDDAKAAKPCHDKLDSCDKLSRAGVCKTSPDAMRENCPQTCNYCRLVLDSNMQDKLAKELTAQQSDKAILSMQWHDLPAKKHKSPNHRSHKLTNDQIGMLGELDHSDLASVPTKTEEEKEVDTERVQAERLLAAEKKIREEEQQQETDKKQDRERKEDAMKKFKKERLKNRKKALTLSKMRLSHGVAKGISFPNSPSPQRAHRKSTHVKKPLHSLYSYAKPLESLYGFLGANNKTAPKTPNKRVHGQLSKNEDISKYMPTQPYKNNWEQINDWAQKYPHAQDWVREYELAHKRIQQRTGGNTNAQNIPVGTKPYAIGAADNIAAPKAVMWDTTSSLPVIPTSFIDGNNNETISLNTSALLAGYYNSKPGVRKNRRKHRRRKKHKKSVTKYGKPVTISKPNDKIKLTIRHQLTPVAIDKQAKHRHIIGGITKPAKENTQRSYKQFMEGMIKPAKQYHRTYKQIMEGMLRLRQPTTITGDNSRTNTRQLKNNNRQLTNNDEQLAGLSSTDYAKIITDEIHKAFTRHHLESPNHDKPVTEATTDDTPAITDDNTMSHIRHQVELTNNSHVKHKQTTEGDNERITKPENSHVTKPDNETMMTDENSETHIKAEVKPANHTHEKHKLTTDTATTDATADKPLKTRKYTIHKHPDTTSPQVDAPKRDDVTKDNNINVTKDNNINVQSMVDQAFLDILGPASA